MPTMTISEPTKQETTDFFKRLKAQHANKASYLPFSFYFFCRLKGQDRPGGRTAKQEISPLAVPEFLKRQKANNNQYDTSVKALQRTEDQPKYLLFECSILVS